MEKKKKRNTISLSYKWAAITQLQVWLLENLGPLMPELLFVKRSQK